MTVIPGRLDRRAPDVRVEPSSPACGGSVQRRLGATSDLVAWPFSVYNDEAIAIARDVGYGARFGLGQRCVTGRDEIMALPRFLVTEVTRAGLHLDAAA